MKEIASATIPGTVEKVVKSPDPSEPERAQIAVEGADHEHKVLQIENTMTDKGGHEVHLTPGAKVEVTITAEPEAIRFGR
jgi:hypothetical protein